MATEEEIAAAEARLGQRLPPSYRAHLASGGSLPGDHGMALLEPGLIDRFSRREPEWLEAWMDGYQSGYEGPASPGALANDPNDPATMPAEQLADTIVISTAGDERLLLLNPAVADEAGEWEAWDFANWYPGAYRHRSFTRLLEALRAES